MIETITQRTEVVSLGLEKGLARGIGPYGLRLRCQTDAAISRKANPEAVYGKASGSSTWAGQPLSRLFRNGRINAACAAILPRLREERFTANAVVFAQGAYQFCALREQSFTLHLLIVSISTGKKRTQGGS